MNKFEDFLQEGQKIQIKRKYTENHPASTVGKTAGVRNEVLKAMKDGILTEEEFTKILSKVSKSPKRWRTANSKYFNVSEDGVKLSKWGVRILSELDIPALNVFPISEGKTLSIGKIGMMGAKILNKIRIGTIFDTKGGQYEVTGFGQQANAFKEFEATIDGKEVKVKLTAMYGIKLEVTDDVRSARFNKEEELNSIILESVVTEANDPYKEIEKAIKGMKGISADIKGDTIIVSNKAGDEFTYSMNDADDVTEFIATIEESLVTEANGQTVKEFGDLLALLLDEDSGLDIERAINAMAPNKARVLEKQISTLYKKLFDLTNQGFDLREDISVAKLENNNNNTNMKNTFIYESFEAFSSSKGILNEALGSSLLASVLSSGKEGKYGRENLKSLAGGFYGLAKVALDKVGDEDMIVSNDPSKVFKENGGSKHILFFISDTEKDNPYCPYDAGYGALKTVPGGGTLIAAMSGDREFYTNDWSRYSRTKSFKKDGKKGSSDQVGVSHKYRGWNGTGLNNGKRIAEVSDRVLIINLDLIRQKYSTQQLRDARAAAKAGAVAFTDDKDFKKANNDRYHQILATKAAKMPLDKMVADAIDMLTDQIKDGLAKGEKTRYDEIKIGQSAKGKEVKLRDASNHMSNVLDDYSRYCDYVRQEEESEKRFGSSESWYKREIKNYALSLKEKIAKIEGFDYAW